MQKRNAYLVMGGIGLFFAFGYLGMSFQLPFGRLDQPGARVFPLIVGVMLLLASLTTMWEGWQVGKAEHIDLPAGADRKSLGYFLALPCLGQIISSTLFCILLMPVLSDLGWPRMVAYSLVISIGLYVVFVLIPKVPLPRGMLGF